jgi:hypothetical protein
MDCDAQAPAPPAGFEDVRSCPELSTPVQKLVLGHDTDVIVTPDSPTGTNGELQLPDSPGLVDASIWPEAPTATHRPAPGVVPGAQLIPKIGNCWFSTCDHLTCSVGLVVESRISPLLSVCRQKEDEAQPSELKSPPFAPLADHEAFESLTDAMSTYPPPASMQLAVLKHTTVVPVFGRFVRA